MVLKQKWAEEKLNRSLVKGNYYMSCWVCLRDIRICAGEGSC